MRIEHIAINVRDLERTRDFFVKYFGARTVVHKILALQDATLP